MITVAPGHGSGKEDRDRIVRCLLNPAGSSAGSQSLTASIGRSVRVVFSIVHSEAVLFCSQVSTLLSYQFVS